MRVLKAFAVCSVCYQAPYLLGLYFEVSDNVWLLLMFLGGSTYQYWLQRLNVFKNN